MSLSKLWEIVKEREAWHAAVHGGHKELDTTKQLNNNIQLYIDIYIHAHNHSISGVVTIPQNVYIELSLNLYGYL